MDGNQLRVTFEPQGRSTSVLPGTSVIEAAASCGLALETPCGGGGTCGKCRVQILADQAPPPSPVDCRVFSADELAQGWRLGCQHRLQAPCTVTVPAGSLVGGQLQIQDKSSVDRQREVVPAVRKVYVELPEPTLADDAPDLVRLSRAVGPVKVTLDTLRRFPGALRAGGFKGTAVVADHHLLAFEAGDTTGRCFGVAFDIGTTTVVGALLDLNTGRELAISSRMNPQISFGDDVLSRIKYAAADSDNLGELRGVICREIGQMIQALCQKASIAAEEVYEVTFAGNTTMQHLLCGLDPTQLGCLPFVPVHKRGLMLEALDLDLPINRHGKAYIFPVIGGFVGGDTVAGILVCELLRQEGPVLMVDIGTNGEIVLAHNGRLFASSTAAGPAFEGARISCGMRATSGAIEKVVFADGKVTCGIIGNCAPAGICGSGLIDAVAELLNHGIVSETGRLLAPEALPATLPPGYRNRVTRTTAGQLQFELGAAPPGRPDAPVALTQRDIRELQLSSGAIRAGIRILLAQQGLRTTDLRRVLIAGGFGSFIRRNHAQTIGLLPPDIDHQRISYVGNVSLAGAKWALISRHARQEAEELGGATHHVELSMDPSFQAEFSDAMLFPTSALATEG